MRTSIIKKTLLLVLMLIASSAWAEWTKVNDTADGNFYVDLATIRRDGNLRKVWAVLDLKQRGKDGEISTRSRFEYDCKEERTRFLSFSAHSDPMAGGTPLTQLGESGGWRDIAPGTVYESILKIVCAK